MEHMLLSEKFKILDRQYESEAYDSKGEIVRKTLVKVLKRVKKMSDAKSEISKIILLIFVRKLKVKLIVEELLS